MFTKKDYDWYSDGVSVRSKTGRERGRRNYRALKEILDCKLDPLDWNWLHAKKRERQEEIPF